jgi:hypothetical protein
MFLEWQRMRIFVRGGAADLRKQTNELAAMSQVEMSGDPVSGSPPLGPDNNAG